MNNPCGRQKNKYIDVGMRGVTGSQMKALDERAIREFGIPSLLLMENAGRGIADLVPADIDKVLIFCGKGNNGGDGLAAARHLHERGSKVKILLFADPENLKEDPKINYDKVSKMKIPVSIFPDPPLIKKLLEEAGLVVDALLGVGINAPLKEPYLSAVSQINASGKKVIAVDLPSGLHTDTGEVMGGAVRAHITGTLGLPKQGLYEGQGPQYAGKIEVIDIGLPKELLT